MLKALMAIGALQLVSMLLLLIRTKALAVWLGPDAVGVMAVIDRLLAVIVQSASLSLPFAALRFLPELWTADKPALRLVFGAMTRLLVALVVVASVATLGVALFDPAILGADLVPHRSVLLAACLTMPVLALVPYLQNVIAGIMRHREAMLFFMANSALLMVGGLAASLGRSLVPMYLWYAASGSVLIGLAWWWCRGVIGRPATVSTSLLGLSHVPRRLWKFSGALMILSFLAPYAALFTQYRILSDYGTAASGWMQAALGVGLAMRGVLGAANQVLLTPQVNRGGTPQERMRWVQEFQRIWCFVAVVLVPPLVLAPNVVVHLLYAESFAPGSQFVYVCVLTEVVTLLGGAYQALVLSFNRLTFHVVTNVLASLLMIGLAAWLIPRIGIMGAALAALGASVFLLVSTVLFLALRFGLRPAWSTTALGLYLIFSLAATGAWSAGGLHATFTSVGAAVGVYMVLVAGLAVFLRREDYARLRGLLRSRAS